MHYNYALLAGEVLSNRLQAGFAMITLCFVLALLVLLEILFD